MTNYGDPDDLVGYYLIFSFVGCGYLGLDIWLLYFLSSFPYLFVGVFLVCRRLQKNYW